jgi:hypothetical protein
MEYDIMAIAIWKPEDKHYMITRWNRMIRIIVFIYSYILPIQSYQDVILVAVMVENKVNGKLVPSSTTFDFSTRWRWIVSFTLWSLYSQGESSPYWWDRKLCVPQILIIVTTFNFQLRVNWCFCHQGIGAGKHLIQKMHLRVAYVSPKHVARIVN